MMMKGKGDAVERGNFRGLKLLDHLMKVFERVIEKYIREAVNIDDKQFGLGSCQEKERWIQYLSLV